MTKSSSNGSTMESLSSSGSDSNLNGGGGSGDSVRSRSTSGTGTNMMNALRAFSSPNPGVLATDSVTKATIINCGASG